MGLIPYLVKCSKKLNKSFFVRSFIKAHGLFWTLVHKGRSKHRK